MHESNESDDGSGLPRVEVTRGIIVIVVAIAVGAFVVTQGLKDDGDAVAAGTDVAAVGGSGDGGLVSESAGGETGEGGGGDGSGSDPQASDGAGNDTADSSMDGAGDGNPDSAGEGAEGSGSTADGTNSDGTGSDGTGSDGTGSDGTGTSPDDPSGPATQAPADVTVLVLNGAGAKGIAGRGSAILSEAGYDVLAPRNATFLGPSKILYTDGFEDEANAVADAYGTDPSAVVEPLDPADPPIDDTRGADVVVVVGEDGLIQV